ncbi:MAG: PQQ-binding-like beta-propeller repeat protein [Bryobacterales bacterium]|nr:PQQ-binding-like beta-propeller repeat protein [Bryobacterales bacterium]
MRLIPYFASRSVTALFCLFAALPDGQAADWPRFRGPNGSGVSEARQLPVKFNAKENLVWKADVPGGTSSPIVVGSRLYYTGFDKDERLVVAVDAKTGKEVWRKSLTKERTESAHPLNGPATPTPASDGKNLYVFFPEIGMVSFDGEGDQRWKTPIGPFHSVQGLAGSPVAAGGLVFLPIDQTRDSFLAAFDAKTGKQRWKVDRPSNPLGSYTTPVYHKPKSGPAQIIMMGAIEIAGYQADTGERLWWIRGMTTAPAASPVLIGDILYASETAGTDLATPFKMFLPMDKNKDGKLERSEIPNAGMQRLLLGVDEDAGNKDGFVEESEWLKFEENNKNGGGMMAIDINGRGDLSKSGIKWRVTKSIPYLTATVLYNDVIYTVRDGGILSSYNPASGEVHKQGRLEGALDKYYAQPVAGDGKIYLTSENGKVSVVKAGKEWELLSVNDLEEPTYATPALADGRVFVRTRKALYCFGTP